MKTESLLSPETWLAGRAVASGARSTAPPIELGTAQLFGSLEEGRQVLTVAPGENQAYRRHGNATVHLLEQSFSRIEQDAKCLAVGSGMSACLLVFSALLRSGDHVILLRSSFYEIGEQLQHMEASVGIMVSRVPGASLAAIIAAIEPHTRMIFVETPTNPTLATLNLRALVGECRSRGILLVVDNTMLTPLGQDVLGLGADISVYSLSKHINGHGDVVGGMVCTHDAALYKVLAGWRACSGMILDPFNAWLTLRGMRSLGIRLLRHADNASRVAMMLSKCHPWLAWSAVWSGPDAGANGIDPTCHTGMMALHFDTASQAACFVDALQWISIGPTFGNLESLVYHYGGIHRGPDDDLAQIEIHPGLVRLSVGIEGAPDLIADIDQALHCSRDR